MTSVLNQVIDQIVQPKLYPKKVLCDIPQVLMSAVESLGDLETSDPYERLGMALGYISEDMDTLEVSKIKWSMKAILTSKEINPDQLIIKGDCTFRDNSVEQDTLSGYLYQSLSKTANPNTAKFKFNEIYADMVKHNHIIKIAEKVAQRYINDYCIVNANGDISRGMGRDTYDTVSTSNTTNRKKIKNATTLLKKRMQDGKSSDTDWLEL